MDSAVVSENQQDDRQLVKVFFTVAPHDYNGQDTETLWASVVTDMGLPDAYQLENSPFFYRGVSYQDIVEAKEVDSDGLSFVRILKKGGHSTYQLLVPKHAPRFAEFWQMLEDLGCTYEYGDEGDEFIYSVDVPPETNISRVYAVLERGLRDKVWVFQEAHVGHDLKR
jgi:hypothetical protein